MTRISSILTAAMVALAAPGAAFAEDDATSLSYISYVERYATLRPAHDKETLDVVVNMPVLAGDRLATARGARLEIVLADATTVWMDEFSTLDFDALAFSRDNPAPRTALYLSDGTAAFELPAHGLGDATLRVDTPAGVLFLQRPGLYRLDVDRGQVEIRSFSGLAELPSGAGSSLLRAGQQAYLSTSGRLETQALYEPRDEFWRWVSERRRPAPPSRTAEQLGVRVASRAAILDSYGDWIYVDSYWAWRPRVAVTWVPYSYGRWYWTPVGWTWISYEPWGWYPYHYGSWTYHPRHGWLWCWDWVWGPAWVHWFYSGSYIGWCPRGYYDSWYWGRYRHYYRSYPSRWSEVTLDFRGRIYLDDIDLRPWTVVPSSHFTHARLDRVRLSPERIRQELPRTPAYVRSGPLFTRDVRPDPNAFEREFRRGLREDNIPDLTRVLRREEGIGDARERAPTVRMLPTRELIRGAERTEGGADTRGGAPGRSEVRGRGEVRGRDGSSDWPSERQPAPVRGGQPEIGAPGRGSEGYGERPPVRVPDRSRPERVDPGTPARGEIPDTPRRGVGRPAPDRSQPGDATSPPGGSGDEMRRPPERRAPAPVRPPTGSSDPSPGRGAAPPPARPPAEYSRPAPPPPREPESPPPQSSRRGSDDRFSAPVREPSQPSTWMTRDAYRGGHNDEPLSRGASSPWRPSAAPPARSGAPRSDYAPPPRALEPSPRSQAPPPRSAPVLRDPAPSASSGSSSSADGGRPSRPPGPGRPAPSRPDR